MGRLSLIVLVFASCTCRCSWCIVERKRRRGVVVACVWLGLCVRLSSKLHDVDDDGALASALRTALLATLADRASVDAVVNNINWQVCGRAELFFLSFLFVVVSSSFAASL